MPRNVKCLQLLLIAVIAVTAVSFTIACEAPAAMPTATPTPTPAPTPTRTPTPTATHTPAPTAALVTSLIRVDPQQDLQGFLRAIPTTERSCLESAFSQADLLRVLTTDQDLTKNERAKVSGCLSEDTARRVMLGQALPDPVSAQSTACVSDKLRGVSLRELVVGDSGPTVETMPIIRAVVTCITSDEFARSGLGGEDGATSQATVACLFTQGSDRTLVNLFTMDQPPSDVLDLIARCSSNTGVGSGAGSGQLQVTAEQQQCILDAIGIVGVVNIANGVREPTQEEVAKIQACGVPLALSQAGPTGSSGGGGQTQLTAQQQQCILAALGEQAVIEIGSGQRAFTANEMILVQGCYPATPVQSGVPTQTQKMQCISDALGTAAILDISNGKRAATQEELAKIQGCSAFRSILPPVPTKIDGKAAIKHMQECQIWRSVGMFSCYDF